MLITILKNVLWANVTPDLPCFVLKQGEKREIPDLRALQLIENGFACLAEETKELLYQEAEFCNPEDCQVCEEIECENFDDLKEQARNLGISFTHRTKKETLIKKIQEKKEVE